ncbi:hypothetical protein ACGFMM_00690 [Streptomyces sp. NPDC048604]|uniref:hypothetical protein n=1 Tax=Streptomyces sp. NPDC048604 TaxID=3365578 RepID=UPI003715182D
MAPNVHRRDLLKEMGVILPESLDEERALWAALAQQLYRGLTDRPRLLRFTGAEGRVGPTPGG